MPGPYYRACGGVSSRCSNYGPACRTPSFIAGLPISRTFAFVLLLSLALLLCLLLGLLGLRLGLC
jgi:hypothetical protein